MEIPGMEIPDNAFESVEDFLGSARFRKWVRGNAAEDTFFWQEFLIQNPEKVVLYEQAVAILLVVGGEQVPELQASYQAGQLRKALEEEVPAQKTASIWQLLRWGVAAMLIISIGFWWQYAFNERPFQAAAKFPVIAGQDSLLITKQNSDRETMLVNLPDGSSVLLSKGSSVSFDAEMKGDERIVHLVGEGFFEVVKDAKRPFFVYADKLTTRVVGTSFRMRSFPGSSEAIVAVKTGKVSVSKGHQTKGMLSAVTLLPNQQMKLLVQNNKLVSRITEQVAPAQMSPLQKEDFEFRFTPVADAFKVLESNYAVRISYNADEMRNCTLTASLKDEPFLEKIRLICLATESTYQVAGDQIIISGTGCP
ncbi:FecR family protein [Dyadobacter sp. Leaf189]|uniref:FecR family protein n=1 Tax=Dyadobacter sp. Leaf189 TaxID=1736295 RepID=UPI000701EB74|nr:FecR family protein [Dyadobacter sp. Leaf189]KQS27011.1 hypothetical protein ASG33_20965 [Dyadobacter sp. Leaf189]